MKKVQKKKIKAYAENFLRIAYFDMNIPHEEVDFQLFLNHINQRKNKQK